MPLTTFVPLAALAFTFGFCLGALLGNHFVTRQQDWRERRQAKRERAQNEREKYIDAKLYTLREFHQAEHSPRTDAPD